MSCWRRRFYGMAPAIRAREIPRRQLPLPPIRFPLPTRKPPRLPWLIIRRAQLRRLQKQEMELLKSLFGPDVQAQMMKDSGGTDWMEKQYGFIPKELREQVQDLDQQMNEAKQEIYAQNDGYMDQYGQVDLSKVERKYHDELAKILTPEQLLEWDLRHSDTANQLKNDLSAFDPNEDEFRALFKYKQAL